MPSSMKKVDVVIIGAGPGGSVAAAYLLKQGYSVCILEKSIFPRYVVGESLLPKSMEHFDEVDLLPVLEKQQYNIKRGAKFLNSESVCDIDFSKKSTEGWSWTWQVPRAHFDKVIADEVTSRGAKIVYNARVTNINFADDPTIKYVVGDETSDVRCKFVIDASGFGNVVPRALGTNVEINPDGKSAFFILAEDKLRGDDSEPDLITFEVPEQGLWFWNIPFSDGTTSLGFVGEKEFFNQVETKMDFRNMMEKHIEVYKERFIEQKFLKDPLYLPSYTQSTQKVFGEKYVLIGNCFGFLDPVFSSGVALATESGLLAAKLLHQHLRGEHIDWQTEYADYMNNGIDVYKSYVSDWYTGDLQKLFWANDMNPTIKAEITSILAGYVWDEKNRLVKKHKTAVKRIAQFI